jgi:hypothetical protein
MERMTGIPLTKHPELAASPEHAPVIAAAYYKWKQNMFPKLDYDNLEHVHRATGPKETFSQRASRMANSGYRLADDADLQINTPAYDAKTYIANDDGSLTKKFLPELTRLMPTTKEGIKPDTTPSSR